LLSSFAKEVTFPRNCAGTPPRSK